MCCLTNLASQVGVAQIFKDIWEIRQEWRKFSKIFGKSGGSAANIHRYLGIQVEVPKIFKVFGNSEA